MYFSFGAVLRFLCEIKETGIKEYQLCSYIFQAFEPTYGEIDSNLTNKLKNNKNIPDRISEGARLRDHVEIRESLVSDVLPCLDLTLQNQFILAVRELLALDLSVPVTTAICQFTKDDLINRDHYVFSEFLTAVLVFALRRNYKKIKDDLATFNTDLSRWNDKADTITVISDSGVVGAYSQLPLSLNPDSFYQAFKELKHSQPFVNSESKARFFYLDVMDFKFDYAALVKYLKKVTAEYVYSRPEIQKAKENAEDFTEIVSDAFSALRKKEHKPEILGQILIYSFLESVLRAPKIMSRFEQEKYYSDRELMCEGIHLLYLPDEPKGKRYQLVIGSATMNDDAETAVQTAVEKLAVLASSGSGKIRGILNENTLRLMYNDELKIFLKNVFYPSDSRFMSVPKTNYGAFVGYSVSVNAEEYPDEESFCEALENKLKNDIKLLIPKAEEKIRNAGGNLSKTPIHFYFVPFDNVSTDAKSILKDFLE